MAILKCMLIPHELKIGNPKKYIWPQKSILKMTLSDGLRFSSKISWFAICDTDTKRWKSTQIRSFLSFCLRYKERFFFKYLDSVKTNTIRDVFDAYMTSYFGAWVNNQNILGQKKFVTAFYAKVSNHDGKYEVLF